MGIEAGSDAGTDDSCAGSGILTSSMLVSMVAGFGKEVGRSFVVIESGRGVLAL